MMQLNSTIKKKILTSLGEPSPTRQEKLKRGNFKYSISWLGNKGWCMKVDHRAYYKVRDLLITRGLVIDPIPNGGGIIAGLYLLRELAY